MSWEWIQYEYPTQQLIHKNLIWMSRNCNLYFAIKKSIDDSWSWYGGAATHALDTGDLLINYATQALAEANYATLPYREVANEALCTWGSTVHGISLANGSAFIRVTGIDLSTYAGVAGSDTPYKIKIVDSAGKITWGWIADSDAAETLSGSELTTNSGFETAGGGGADVFAGWTENTSLGGTIADETSVVNAGGHACKLTTGSVLQYPWVSQTISVTPGKLYKISFYTRGDGTNAGRTSMYSGATQIWGVTTTGVTGTSYTKKTYYVTPNNNTLILTFLSSAVGSAYSYWDTVSVQEVTDVGIDGVHIVSKRNGTTRNWESIESGFNYNDTNYSFSIYTPGEKAAVEKAVAIFPTVLQAKYIRMYIEVRDAVSIYEWRPASYFTADEIVSGELHITDDLSSAPIIRVSKTGVDRIKIGNISGSTYGIAGYDANAATIFELSNTKNNIAGWDFTATKFSSNDVSIANTGRIRAGSGNNIVQLDSQDSTYRFWVGNAVAANAPFRVTKTGKLYADGAEINGTLAASSVTTRELSSRTITHHNIVINTVTATELSASCITANKIRGADFGLINITSGTIIFSDATSCVINTASGLLVKGTGGIIVEDGGDITLIGDDSNAAVIKFRGDKEVYKLGVSTSGENLALCPSFTATAAFLIGYGADASDAPLDSFKSQVNGQTRFVTYSKDTILRQTYIHSTGDEYEVGGIDALQTRIRSFRVAENLTIPYADIEVYSCGGDSSDNEKIILTIRQDIAESVTKDSEYKFLDDSEFEINAATTLDPTIIFSENNTEKFCIGVDSSDFYRLKINNSRDFTSSPLVTLTASYLKLTQKHNNYHGSMKDFIWHKTDMADNATLALPNKTMGILQVCASASTKRADGIFSVYNSGVIHKIAGMNSTSADVDSNLCVYNVGTHGTIANRLDGAAQIRITYRYN